MSTEIINALYNSLNECIFVRDSNMIDLIFNTISRLCFNDIKSVAESIGVIIQIGSGNGKSELLNTIKSCIEQVIGTNINVQIIDLCHIQFVNEEGAFKLAIEVQKCVSKVKNTLLLIDNIDVLSHESDVSILCNLIDKFTCQSKNSIAPKVGLICTCSNESKLLNHLYQPHRLGNPIKIDNLSDDSKRQLFNVFLQNNYTIINFDTEYSKFSSDAICSIDDLVEALVKITIGFNIGDIFYVFRESSKTSTEYDTPEIKISVTRLIKVAFTYRSRVQYREYDKKYNSVNCYDSTIPIGIKPILDRIRTEIIYPLSSSETFNYLKKMEIPFCSGIVVHGPIGCGKTTLTNWILCETKHIFASLSISCADLVDKIVGESEKKISRIFEHARKISPCFLVLDNIDIIFGTNDDSYNDNKDNRDHKSKRTSHKALDRVLSSLLVEIDGISTIKDNIVIVIATTTDISNLDSTLIRPGRLELHIEVPLPDYSQRKAIITDAIVKRFKITNTTINTIIGNLAHYTSGKSVADIIAYVNETIFGVIREIVSDCIEVNEQNVERILHQRLLKYNLK